MVAIILFGHPGDRRSRRATKKSSRMTVPSRQSWWSVGDRHAEWPALVSGASRKPHRRRCPPQTVLVDCFRGSPAGWDGGEDPADARTVRV